MHCFKIFNNTYCYEVWHLVYSIELYIKIESDFVGSTDNEICYTNTQTADKSLDIDFSNSYSCLDWDIYRELIKASRKKYGKRKGRIFLA
jgi:hypothetical protein